MSDVHDQPSMPAPGGDPRPDGSPAPPIGTGRGERRLDRAPSDRYGSPAGGDAAASLPAIEPTGTAARGLASGILVAAAGAVIIVVLGGAFSISAGLLVVAAAMGYAIAVATRAGAGARLARSTRAWVVVGLAVGAVLIGQVGLWLYARSEGGVLGLPDYLAQVYGVLVPAELVVAAVAAWWAAR